MPNDKRSPDYLLGQIEERTRVIPEMQRDVSDIKGKVDNLPCGEQAARMERVEEHIEEVRIRAAGETPKLTLLWQILLWLLGAGVVFLAGAAFGNGGP